jgi:hypothetical protein
MEIKMNFKHKMLLLIDCSVNLILGLLLLLFPAGIVDLLGLPPTKNYFYPSILGAVLSGIGLALLLELAGHEKHVRGLGLGGAVVINIAGSLVLIWWLVFGALVMPLRGRFILWTVGVIVFSIGAIELAAKSCIYNNKGN